MITKNAICRSADTQPLTRNQISAKKTPRTLDTTHQTLVTREWLDQVRSLPRIGSVLSATVERYAGSGALHDPNTIAFIEEPGIYQTRRGTIHSGPQGETTLTESEDGPHEVTFSADADRFFALLLTRLKAADQR